VVWVLFFAVLHEAEVSWFAWRCRRGRGSRGRVQDGGASKEYIWFLPVKGSKGWEGSKCLYSGRVLGS
jgi:hypothetical protein